MTRAEMIEKANVIRSRDRFGAMTAEELAALKGTERTLEVPFGEGSVRVYELRPDCALPEKVPLILNFHGGGFIKGRTERDKRYASFLADALHCVVWDVDYSLAPERPFPRAPMEAYAVLCYAAEQAEERGFDRSKIALAGHSAGGALAAGAMLLARRQGSFLPCCALLEYFPSLFTDPVENLSESMKADPFWSRRAQVEREYQSYYFSAPEDARDPLCAVGRATDEELSGFPPLLVLSAETDTLRAETEGFAERLSSLGVCVTSCRCLGAVHGFTVNRTDGWEKALAIHEAFFRSHF